MNNPLNSNGVADSRDLIEYKEHLESEILDAYIDWAEDANEHGEGIDLEIPNSFDDIEFIDEEAFTMTCKDLIEEYEAIKDFCEELDGYGDFEYGESIIGRDYFEEYCEEFVKDCGYIPHDLPSFIESAIDWSKVADEMEQDYTTATFDGNEYLMRA